MTFLQLSDSLVPGQLRNVTLVGKSAIPRYWANVWLIMSMGHLNESTQTGKLRYIEDLYQHADRIMGPNGLDDALVGVCIRSGRNMSPFHCTGGPVVQRSTLWRN
jgi:hypothetical protein